MRNIVAVNSTTVFLTSTTQFHTTRFAHRSIKIGQDAFPDFNFSLVDEEEETDDYPSVNVAYMSNKGKIYGGGEFAKFNNMYSLTYDTFTALIGAPGADSAPATFSEGDDFYECNKRAANATNRRAQLTSQGADFCCKSGSYCPDEAVDIACPKGWGYHCSYDTEPTTCLEGYYCENVRIYCPHSTYIRFSNTLTLTLTLTTARHRGYLPEASHLQERDHYADAVRLVGVLREGRANKAPKGLRHFLHLTHVRDYFLLGVYCSLRLEGNHAS